MKNVYPTKQLILSVHTTSLVLSQTQYIERGEVKGERSRRHAMMRFLLNSGGLVIRAVIEADGVAHLGAQAHVHLLSHSRCHAGGRDSPATTEPTTGGQRKYQTEKKMEEKRREQKRREEKRREEKRREGKKRRE